MPSGSLDVEPFKLAVNSDADDVNAAVGRAFGSVTVMVNGRLSSRSFSRYRRTRFFWRQVLKNVDAAGMISEVDASRIAGMGMDPAKISILGNAKYDALAKKKKSEEIVSGFSELAKSFAKGALGKVGGMVAAGLVGLPTVGG